MIVDDQADNREIVGIFLSRAGATTVLAESARAALQHLETLWPDLIVADISMPEQDGYSLIHSIRNLPGKRSGIPAVALTAHVGKEEMARALREGYNLHVGKPVVGSELVQLLSTLLQQANTQP